MGHGQSREENSERERTDQRTETQGDITKCSVGPAATNGQFVFRTRRAKLVGRTEKDRQVLRPAEASAETKILSGPRSALSTGPTQGPSEQQGLANGTKTHQKSPWKVALLIQGRPLDSQSYLLYILQLTVGVVVFSSQARHHTHGAG